MSVLIARKFLKEFSSTEATFTSEHLKITVMCITFNIKKQAWERDCTTIAFHSVKYTIW